MNQFEMDSFNEPFNIEEAFYSIYFNDPQEKLNYYEQILNEDKEESLQFIYTIADKSTNYKNENKKNNQLKINTSSKKKINDKGESKYKLYRFEEIKKYLQNFSNIIKFIKSKKIIKAENKLSDEKIKKEEITENNIDEINQNLCQKKKGRKCDENQKRKLHDKNSADNCIKNVKAKLLKYLVNFMNKIMGKTDKNKLYYLNYKYANELKKSTNLDLFEMSLKDLLSKEITPKLRSLDKNFNKILIQRIENQEEFVEDYNTTMFALNMKFGDWIQLFTLKKSLIEISNFDDKIDIYRIVGNLNDIYDLLYEMSTEYDDEYFSLFIFYLYNYERWFAKIHGRNIKKQ